MGAEVTVCGPSTLVPPEIESLGAKINYNIHEVIEESDVLMPLRIQMERQQQKFLPSLREYAKEFGIDKKKLEPAKKDVIIMHPGPTNRGLEVSAEVADGKYSVILNQVTNGVAVRMAVLYLLLGAKGKSIEEK